MAALLIGYARCSTDRQDSTAQRDGLVALGVAVDRVYVDHGLTGTNRERPRLREALAACREGDTLEFVEGDEPDLGTSADTAALERGNARGTHSDGEQPRRLVNRHIY